MLVQTRKIEMKNLTLWIAFILFCFEVLGQDSWREVTKADSLRIRNLERKIDDCYNTELSLTDSVSQLIYQTHGDTKIKAIKLLKKLNNPISIEFIVKNFEIQVFPAETFEECCFPYQNIIHEHVNSNLFLKIYNYTFSKDSISKEDFEKLKWIDYFIRNAPQLYKTPYRSLEELIIIDKHYANDYLLVYDSKAYKFEENLLLGLSNESQAIRDSCAMLIKKTLSRGENFIRPGNVIEHEEHFWDYYSGELPRHNTVDGFFQKNDLKVLKRFLLDRDSVYQVDNTYAIVVKIEHKTGKVQKAHIIAQIDYKRTEPPEFYTGIWRDYFINGELYSALSFENGFLSGSCYHYFPDGNLRSSSYYRDNILVEFREYDQRGRLLLKKSTNTQGEVETLRYEIHDGKMKVRKD